MKTPLEKTQIGNSEEEENTLTVAIYEEFVSVAVSLTITESSEAMTIGGVPEEREALNRLLRRIFKEKKDNMVIFSGAINFGMWRDSINFEVPDLSDGAFSKTAIFILDQRDYEKSLEDTIKYIKESFSLFQNPRGKQSIVARRVLGKYFK